ncbi:32041_t:CDS:2 [Racocetra persica]|uniref:32041_t:CDS:1 n=1 Tax=Racocetra persica TaxID=160502 RepID=A0ACA9NUJ9_9GLOM|nr:32041_t:CDS:2 [Racocetra persica]
MSKNTEQKALQLPSKSGSEQVNLEKCLNALHAKYNKNATLDQKMNELVELCKEFGEQLPTFRSKKS